MKFVSKLSPEATDTLHEVIKHHPNHRARMRAHAVLLSDAGFSRKELAAVFFISQADTISQWFNRWEHKGLSGLLDEERSGRPEILTDGEKADAIEVVKSSPRSMKQALDLLRN